MFTTLLVEDNTTFRQTLKMALGMRFPLMKIHEAADGEKALQKADALSPDLIIMDLKLPDSNGLELTKIIKKDHSNTIIVILTNHDSQEYQEAAYQSGANHFVSKVSASREELLELVESILSTKKTDS